MNETLCILGLESSCDDTDAAVIRHRPKAATGILSSVVISQADLHSDFGGVVPEIAARAHAEKLDFAIEKDLNQASLGLSDLDAVSVTAGPGLIEGVFSGVMCAKGIAAGADLPMTGVNHLAGHALTPRLTHGIGFPYLTLLVSGGHYQFLLVRGPNKFRRLGGTIDDAPGEAFDKVARMLGLPQPGGPAVEAAAIDGHAGRYPMPRPLLNRSGCDMSFSDLKSAVLQQRDELVKQQGGLKRQDRADLCAEFQTAVCDVFAQKSKISLEQYLLEKPSDPVFTVTGGLAANLAIRTALETVCGQYNVQFIAPPQALCTDSAAMIAWAGMERFREGHRNDVTLGARPRWPLETSSSALFGSGKKGAKA